MKLFVENVVEQGLLSKELENSNIHASFIPFESDVLGKTSKSGDAYGYFDLETEEYELAREILDNLRQTAKEDEISQSKTNAVVTVPRILVSLLILVQFLVIGYLFYENNRLEKLTHYAENLSDYTRKWNAEKTILSRYYKDTEILEAEYIDKNFNQKWEEEKFYDKKGRIRTWNISTKDNGFFDTSFYYDTKGNLVQKIHNSEMTERNDVLDVFVDPNHYLEFTEVHTGNEFYSVENKTK